MPPRLEYTYREYTEDERVEAVGLALAIGSTRAARQLGFPPRTVNKWLHDPEYAWVTRVSRERIDGLLTHTVELALQEVERGLKNPRVKLTQKARALEIISRQAQFMKMADAWDEMEKLLGEIK